MLSKWLSVKEYEVSIIVHQPHLCLRVACYISIMLGEVRDFCRGFGSKGQLVMESPMVLSAEDYFGWSVRSMSVSPISYHMLLRSRATAISPAFAVGVNN